MRRFRRLLVTALASTLMLTMAAQAGFDHKRADGRTLMPIPEVQRVYYSGPGTLRLSQGERPGLVISGADGVLRTIVVEVAADALFIEAPAGASERLVVEVTLPTVSEVVSEGRNVVLADSLDVGDLSIEGKGAGSFRFTGLRAEELLVTGYDDAAFTISGSVERQVLDLQGDGRYQARNLRSQSVEATISGAGVILLAVEKLLDVNLAGAASVRYVGSPYVWRKVSGPGSVTPVAELSI